MTREEFIALRRGDVVQWVDGTIGVVRGAYTSRLLITWEDGRALDLRIDEIETIRMFSREKAA